MYLPTMSAEGMMPSGPGVSGAWYFSPSPRLSCASVPVLSMETLERDAIATKTRLLSSFVPWSGTRKDFKKLLGRWLEELPINSGQFRAGEAQYWLYVCTDSIDIHRNMLYAWDLSRYSVTRPRDSKDSSANRKTVVEGLGLRFL
eukprot:IDg8470t1